MPTPTGSSMASSVAGGELAEGTALRSVCAMFAPAAGLGAAAARDEPARWRSRRGHLSPRPLGPLTEPRECRYEGPRLAACSRSAAGPADRGGTVLRPGAAAGTQTVRRLHRVPGAGPVRVSPGRRGDARIRSCPAGRVPSFLARAPDHHRLDPRLQPRLAPGLRPRDRRGRRAVGRLRDPAGVDPLRGRDRTAAHEPAAQAR